MISKLIPTKPVWIQLISTCSKEDPVTLTVDEYDAHMPMIFDSEQDVLDDIAEDIECGIDIDCYAAKAIINGPNVTILDTEDRPVTTYDWTSGRF